MLPRATDFESVIDYLEATPNKKTALETMSMLDNMYGRTAGYILHYLTISDVKIASEDDKNSIKKHVSIKQMFASNVFNAINSSYNECEAILGILGYLVRNKVFDVFQMLEMVKYDNHWPQLDAVSKNSFIILAELINRLNDPDHGVQDRENTDFSKIKDLMPALKPNGLSNILKYLETGE